MLKVGPQAATQIATTCIAQAERAFSLFGNSSGHPRLPEGVTHERGVKLAQPPEGYVYRGTNKQELPRHQQHPAAFLVGGVENCRSRQAHITVKEVHEHRLGHNSFVSTSAAQQVATNGYAGVGGIVAKYDTTTVPLIDMSKTLLRKTFLEYGTFSALATKQIQEYTALFLLQHTLVQISLKPRSLTGSDEIVPNPFYIHFDAENTNDRKLLERAARINDLFYKCLQESNSGIDFFGRGQKKLQKALSEYVTEVIHLYDEKFGVKQNPLRKSLQELRTWSPEAEKYVAFIERSGTLISTKSAVDLLSKDGTDGLDSEKCASFFKQNSH